jgi:pimeloyl-ACP methyl ester carboxylesterase
MALPALVLVHGGQHAADCWAPTIDELKRQVPELTVLAVDLPGRCGKPGEFVAATIADWAQSVVSDIRDAGIDDLLIVGHSMAGLTVPGVVTILGAEHVREIIFAAAYIPPDGKAMLDTLPGLLGWYARRSANRNVARNRPGTMPTAMAMYSFCNGMSRTQRKFNRDRFYPESASVVLEAVDRSQMPGRVPRTWILTKRDRALSPKTQRRSIEALGGVQTLIEVDTCHNLMISEPKRLAEILVERCRAYQ